MPARIRLIACVALLATLSLAGCGLGGANTNDPVIMVATSAPPNSGFQTYRHPSGVFSLRVPPDWIAEDLPDSNGVRVQFSDPEGTQAITRLSITIVNTGQPMTPEAFAQAVNAYQPPPDLANFQWTELERTDQADLSRRITGVRTYPALGPRSLNIFLQRNGSFFSALELDITGADPAMMETLRTVINTFRVDPNAELTIGTVQQAAAGVTAYSGIITFDSYLAWTERDGTFHISGEAVNTTLKPLEAVQLSGVLFDSQGRRLSEQSDILAVDVLGPGQSAPFDLRFEGGKPASTVRYELHAAARQADYVRQSFYGPENFAVANDQALYNERSNLVIQGELANIGPRAASAVKVVAAIWDDQGHIVASDTVFIAKSQLVPQEAASFEVTFYALGGPAVRYTLIVSGSVAQ